MRKAMIEMKKETISKGRMKRSREIPADLIATSSKLSPKLPKVMMEEISMASGSASGIAVAVTYNVSSKMLARSRPLPTRSSMYFQKNCITNTNSVMKKVAINGPTNDLRISLSSFLITIWGCGLSVVGCVLWVVSCQLWVLRFGRLIMVIGKNQKNFCDNSEPTTQNSQL